MLSVNSSNYVLTKDGVINKLDTHWDRLKEITHKLEVIGPLIQKKLANSFMGVILLFMIIFWLQAPRENLLIFFVLISLSSLGLVAVQISNYLQFRELQKKGQIIYEELNQEMAWNPDLEIFEEISVEERISLNNFLIASQLDIPFYAYFALLGLLPISVITFCLTYYFYNLNV